MKNYQDAVTKAVFKLTEKEDMKTIFGDQTFWDKLSSVFNTDAIIDILKNAAFGKQTSVFKETLKIAITGYFQDAGMKYDDASSVVDQLANILVKLILSHPNYFITAIKNGKSLFLPHYTETTLSWLIALKGIYHEADENISKLLTGGETYRVATINCPVNISVYDTDGVLRGQIIKDEVQDVGEYGLNVYINEDGEKCFILPDCEEFSFKIEAYDQGEMTVSFSEYNVSTEQKTESVNYYDIPIDNGTTFTAALEEKGENGINKDVQLYDSENKTIRVSETIDYASTDSFSVSVLSDKEECIVLGGGSYNKGEFAKVTAIQADGYQFVGWYDGETLVSTEEAYRFRPTGDITLTAKFKPAALPGDVSGDGKVTAEDARLALRAAVGLETYEAGFPEFLAADATKDGKITAEDARLILRAAVGLETLAD